MKKWTLRSGAALAAMVISVAGGHDARAQTAAGGEQSASPDAGGVADIVVTAQRKSESLRKVPIAVTAISPEVATSLGIRDLKDVQLVTPSVSFGNSYTFSQVYIRGIGVIYPTPGLEAPVAIYQDGIYLERGIGNILNLVDPANVQVLRGPQGTLYGRNATGGVILANTADPSFKREVKIALEGGNLSHRQVDVMANQPLSDTVSLRLAGRYNNDGNYITNLFDGTRSGRYTDYLVRGKLLWQPSEAFSLLLSSEYNKNYARTFETGRSLGPGSCLACDAFGYVPPNGFYVTNEDVTDYVTSGYFTQNNLKLTFDSGPLTFTSLTGYRTQRRGPGYTDTDFSPVRLFVYGSLTGGKTFTQDVQVSSDFEGPLNFIAGASYLKDKGFFDVFLEGAAFDPVNSLFPDPIFNRSKTKTTSIAGFLEGSFQLSERLKITAGGRYSRDKRTLQVANNPAATAAFGIASFGDKATFESFTPRAVVAYDSDFGNMYYSYSHGFKAGGFATPITSPSPVVKPEKIYSHEVGLKSRLFNGMVNTNLAGFYYTRKAVQQQIYDPLRAGPITVNAARGEGYGVEAEVQIAPAAGFNVGLSATYLHAEFTSYPGGVVVCATPGGLVTCSRDLSGVTPPRSPRFQGSANASYEFGVGEDGRAGFSGIVAYTAKYDFNPMAGGDLGWDQQKGYALVNASAFIQPSGMPVRITVYAENLFSQKYTQFRQANAPFGIMEQAARPRQYGLRLEYKFSE